MTISSPFYANLVQLLKAQQKTITVIEQTCGGVMASSIMAQPGASAVFYGSLVVYNTKRSKPLLLNDEGLHQHMLSTQNVPPGMSDAEAYVQSKKQWTAALSQLYCEQLGVDYAIAEGGAAGPTFRHGIESAFSVIGIAGRRDGKVSLLDQQLIYGPTNDRRANMRYFADEAAKLAIRAIAGQDAMDEAVAHNGASTEALAPHAPALDRAGHLRSDGPALEELALKAQYIVVQDRQILQRDNTTLAVLNYEDVIALGGVQRRTFLGLHSSNKTPYFAIDLLSDDHATPPYGTNFVDTRTMAPLFAVADNELALHATAYGQWQRKNQFCTLCGHPVAFVDGSTCSQCLQCRHRSWPRQDPSMIAIITSRDQQRVLLARSPRHPEHVHTVLAGFVEVGETFETCVAREVYEETGLHIDMDSIRYVGSQPWPFPQSCMIGFMATADDAQPLTVDTNELVRAQWFTKDEVAQAAAVPGATMQIDVADAAMKANPHLPLLIPPTGVIARKLIDRWLDGK